MSLIRGFAPRFGTSSSPTTGAKPSNVYQQQPTRTGLLVTQELDKAIVRCRAKVEEIAEECRNSNQRFRDIEFDLENDRENCLHGLTTPYLDKFFPSDVLRVSQIFENPQFIIDGAKSSDLEQGGLRNCWFISAVATLTSMPGLIDKICVSRDEQVGIYGFIFFRDGEWADVIIDDQLYTAVPKYELVGIQAQRVYHRDKELYNKVARKGSKTLYFARSSQENETWVPLLEKAYAKFHGDYASLSGGDTFEALEDLTGGVSQVFYTNEIIDTDRFWREDLLQAAKDRLFGCGLADYQNTSAGLMGSHAYAILAAAEYNGKRFLKIRDPWGKSQWTGCWSDGSKEWTKEWYGALDLLEHNFGDCGAFIMEYEDFIQTWYTVERTLLFDTSWMQSTHWLKVTPRAFPCAWQYGDVSFTFNLSKASPAMIVLSRLDPRFFAGMYNTSALQSFDFVLFKKGSERILGRSRFSIPWPRSIMLNKVLEAGEYVLHVRLDRNPSISERAETDSVTDRAPRSPPPKPRSPPPRPRSPLLRPPSPSFRQPSPLVRPPSRADPRKLSRVSSEVARGMSIAANFDSSDVGWKSHLVVPLETFAGRDLTEIEIENFEAVVRERKMLHDKFFPPPPPADPVGSVEEASTEDEDYPEALEGENKIPDGTPVPSVKTEVSTECSDFNALVAPTSDSELKLEKLDIAVSGDNEVAAAKDHGFPRSPSDSAVSPIRIRHPSPEPRYRDFTCTSCNIRISGVRWRCMVCHDDFCDKCHSAGVQFLQHSITHRMHKIKPFDAVHFQVSCDGCEMNPVTGLRWKCLACDNYDLCDTCKASGAHPDHHRMLKIESPADAKILREMPNKENFVLGLRVYTKDDAPVTISGQFRHGNLISWKKDARVAA